MEKRKQNTMGADKSKLSKSDGYQSLLIAILVVVIAVLLADKYLIA